MTGENSVVRALLFGRQGFTGSTNKEITNATISFVLTTERFNSPFFFLSNLSRSEAFESPSYIF